MPWYFRMRTRFNLVLTVSQTLQPEDFAVVYHVGSLLLIAVTLSRATFIIGDAALLRQATAKSPSRYG